MATYKVTPPFPVIPDIDGEPLEDGYVYIGEPGLNPIASPISVYWDPDLTIPAVQPLRTIGGYLSRSGSPGRIFIDGLDYSISTYNKNNTLVWSELRAIGPFVTTDVTQYIASLADLPTVVPDQQINVAGYYPDTTIGGGRFIGVASGRHDGGTFIDPTRSAEIGTAAYYVDSGVDVAGWRRVHTKIKAHDFGALDDCVFSFNSSSGALITISGTDNTAAFKALSQASQFYGVVEFEKSKTGTGSYHYTDSIDWKQDNTEIIVRPDVNIVLNVSGSSSTRGHGFGINGLDWPSDLATQVENVFVSGGGSFYTFSNGTNENGLGFSAAKNCGVENINFPVINRKAFTAQGNIDGFSARKCRVGLALHDGFTVEGDSFSPGVYKNKNIIIDDVIIEDTRGSAYFITYVAGPRTENVSITNVTVEQAANTATYSNIVGLYEDNITIKNVASGHGIDYYQCDGLTSGLITVENPNTHAIRFRECEGKSRIATLKVSGVDGHPIVKHDNPIGKASIDNIISDTATHTYIVDSIVASTSRITIGQIDCPIGTSGFFAGWAPRIAFNPEVKSITSTTTEIDAFACGTVFLDSASSLTISNINNMVEGQSPLTVFCTNGTHTIEHNNGNIRLSGGVDINFSAGETRQFIRAGSLVYEIPREN